MKTNFTLNRTFKVVFLLLSAGSFAQKTVINEVDPRQYIKVLYQKTTAQNKFETIWNWENNNKEPNQKYNYLDANGEIKIDFSKNELILNKDFEGTISLEAEISGDNGTRKIEVNPYSEIGVERVPIGIKSDAPSEIAKKLLNMFIELQDVDYDFLTGYRSFTKNDIYRKKNVEERGNEIKKSINTPYSRISDIASACIMLEEFISDNTYDPRLGSRYKFDDPNISKKDLGTKLDAMIQNYNIEYENRKTKYVDSFKKSYNFATEKVGIILDYLNSFESGGEDATKAFLSLINKDLVAYNALKKNLTIAQKNLSTFKFEDNDPALELLLLNNTNLLVDTYKSLQDISSFRGSQFEKILDQFATDKNEGFDKNDDDKLEKQRTRFIKNNLQDLSVALSEEAGKIIYKKLVYATIDLGKSGAKPNEVLNLYVTWILDSKKDKPQNSPRLPIGKFFIRETGWKTEITDMFALIKRIHEPDVDQATVSPSNFKGSGGVVLMWTYNKEDIGIKENANGKIVRKRAFVNFLEPSIGVNVSYLDFSTAKDVEIGTGLQLGLFKNKIFFGYGVNLHMISPSGQAPGYFYLGFSFAKLSDLFKNSGKITAN
jgi:hypothetical protein